MPAPVKNAISPAKDVERNKAVHTVSENNYRDLYANFIATAAHDLQAPLRKLEVLTDRLLAKYKPSPTEEVEQYTNRIHTCIGAMRSLVDGFTELAAAVPAEMQDELCDLEQIIKRIWQESASLIKEKEAGISLVNIPGIMGDKSQLRLLFKKLLENSFKFSRQDIPLKITINSEKLPGTEQQDLHLPENILYYKISMDDNGIGFNPEDSGNIFQPLVRLHGKAAFAGNGLGLALVKRIADNHQGRVYAEKNNEGGARIILVLPENHKLTC